MTSQSAWLVGPNNPASVTLNGKSFVLAFASDALSKITLIAAMAFVIGGVFVWAIFIRKRGDHSRDYTLPQNSPGHSHRKSSRSSHFWGRRRRRKKERPRNPTLAETRGLPDVRADNIERPGQH